MHDMDVAADIRERLTAEPNAQALELNGIWHRWRELDAVARRLDAVLTQAAAEVGSLGIALEDDKTEIRLVAGLERRRTLAPSADPDVAIQMLTSGTTGTPKRVPLTWRMMNLSLGDARAVSIETFRGGN